MTPTVERPAAAVPDVPVYRLSASEYLAMCDAGILGDEARIELLNGWLVPKMTKNAPHIAAGILLARLLLPILPAGFSFAPEAPVEAEAFSVPEPDGAILGGEPEAYFRRRPEPKDVALVIEIADSSLESDTTTKSAIYAAAGIPIYWVVAVRAGEERLEVFTDPEPAGYRTRTTYRAGDRIPLILDGTEVASIAVADLLPL